MAPRRSRKPTAKALDLDLQIVQFSAEDSIEVDPLIDPQLLSLPTLSRLSTPSQPSTPSISIEDQSDRIEWSTQMIQVLFTELLEQVQDGKRANSRFKKEAWDFVLREVQLVYSGSYSIPLHKIKQKEQAYKALYKD